MKETIKVGSKVISKEAPEWGTWVIKEIHADGYYVIRCYGRETIIHFGELRFWEVQ